MRYYITATRHDDGKQVGLAGNGTLTLNISDGAKVIARLTVFDGKVWDRDNNEIR